jgi:hypothetical protein
VPTNAKEERCEQKEQSLRCRCGCKHAHEKASKLHISTASDSTLALLGHHQVHSSGHKDVLARHQPCGDSVLDEHVAAEQGTSAALSRDKRDGTILLTASASVA